MPALGLQKNNSLGPESHSQKGCFSSYHISNSARTSLPAREWVPDWSSLTDRESIQTAATAPRPCLHVGARVTLGGLYDLSGSLRKEALSSRKKSQLPPAQRVLSTCFVN